MRERPQGYTVSLDTIAGLAIVAVGASAIWIASGYSFGSPQRMGAGFAPIMLGIILCVMGLAIAVARPDGDAPRPSVRLRPIVAVLGSLLLFAVLVRSYGLVPAVAAMVPAAVVAEPGAPVLRTVLLTIALAALVSVVFVWGLNVPMRLVRW